MVSLKTKPLYLLFSSKYIIKKIEIYFKHLLLQNCVHTKRQFLTGNHLRILMYVFPFPVLEKFILKYLYSLLDKLPTLLFYVFIVST